MQNRKMRISLHLLFYAIYVSRLTIPRKSILTLSKPGLPHQEHTATTYGDFAGQTLEQCAFGGAGRNRTAVQHAFITFLLYNLSIVNLVTEDRNRTYRLFSYQPNPLKSMHQPKHI
jgi:hypothetical protein